MRSRARASVLPITMRSGSLKSRIAAPSRKNSGFDTTAQLASGRVSRMMRSTSSPVPTGTVDLVTTTVKPSSACAISRAESYTKLRSAKPSPRRTDRNEYRIRGSNCTNELSREFESASAGIAGDHFVETGLIDRHLAAIKRGNFRLVLVDTDHLMAEIGK